MKLTEQQIEIVTDAGRYRLPAKNLALLLDFPEKEVKAALYDPESEIGKYYAQGKAMFFIGTMKALEKKAESGDERAAKELIRIQKYLIERDAIDDFCGNP